MIGNSLHCHFRVHVRKPMSFKTRGMFLFVHQVLFWTKCPVHENRHNSRFGSHPMPIVAARSDICNMTHLALAAAGGCYLRSAALPPQRVICPVTCTQTHALLVSRARQRPIASTGRQGNCCSACKLSTECEAAQMRNAVCQTDTHSDAADASKASGQAEVCGPT